MAGFIGLWLTGLFHISNLWRGDSDNAFPVIAGNAILHGNFLLKGYYLSSLVTYYPVDLYLNALFIKLLGFRPLLIHIVPFFIYLALIAVAYLYVREPYVSYNNRIKTGEKYNNSEINNTNINNTKTHNTDIHNDNAHTNKTNAINRVNKLKIVNMHKDKNYRKISAAGILMIFLFLGLPVKAFAFFMLQELHGSTIVISLIAILLFNRFLKVKSGGFIFLATGAAVLAIDALNDNLSLIICAAPLFAVLFLYYYKNTAAAAQQTFSYIKNRYFYAMAAIISAVLIKEAAVHLIANMGGFKVSRALPVAFIHLRKISENIYFYFDGLLRLFDINFFGKMLFSESAFLTLSKFIILAAVFGLVIYALIAKIKENYSNAINLILIKKTGTIVRPEAKNIESELKPEQESGSGTGSKLESGSWSESGLKPESKLKPKSESENSGFKSEDKAGSLKFDAADKDFIDFTLSAAVIFLSAAFLLSDIAISRASARYLTPVAVYALILSFRIVPGYIFKYIEKTKFKIVAAFIIVVYMAAFINQAMYPIPKSPFRPLGKWLLKHHLNYGYGSYCDAGIITLMTDGKVKVRQTLFNSSYSDKLVQYKWLSKTGWYKKKGFFVIYSEHFIYGSINKRLIIKEFGKPGKIYIEDFQGTIGRAYGRPAGKNTMPPYVILIYNKGINID